MQRPKMSEVVATVLALGVLGATWSAVQWAPAGPIRWLSAGCAVVGAATLMLWGLLIPGARLLAGERAELTSRERARLKPVERVEAVNNARQALMQSVTGLVVIVGAIFTAGGLLYTARTLDVTQQGQLTDRYTRAIEQLGSSKPEVRMGGIYALERMMNDSDRSEDTRTILEVLAAYVRSHAQDAAPPGVDKTRLAVDVQSALTVLGRARHPVMPDLQGVDFHRKNLSFVNLSGISFSDADLRWTKMVGVNLSKARMVRTHLTGADLAGATLSGAYLANTTLIYADLTRANMSDANLYGTQLVEADMRGANLARANLSHASLCGATLSSANLTDALLIEADLGVGFVRGIERLSRNDKVPPLPASPLEIPDHPIAKCSSAWMDDAILRGADLSGANLHGVQGLTEEAARKVARVDKDTQF
ncbi:pentapeptide repeat-containing protein [Actinomadura chokoriensis]|uniref:pentapeptide repeat-containing protein n=1 Tax=Actinomadura chokoriensis TaxID=454156 RepID=UPI0031F83EAA